MAALAGDKQQGEAPPVYSLGDFSSQQWQQALASDLVFLLAEAAINDKVPALAEQINKTSAPAHCLYWGETARQHSSISPFLIEADSNSWPLLEQEICQQPNWGIAIELDWYMAAHTPIQQQLELLQHLRSWSWLQTEAGESQILRIADFDVLECLLSASTLEQASALFGPIKKIIRYQGGEFSVLQCPNKSRSQNPAPQPRQLSPAQWQALQQFSQSGQMAQYQQHLQTSHAAIATWPPSQLEAFIEQQLAIAQQQSFGNQQDCAKFLSLAYIMGPGFEQQAWAQKLIQAKPQGPQTLMDKLYQAAMEQIEREGSV